LILINVLKKLAYASAFSTFGYPHRGPTSYSFRAV